jgi:hypothetical protein
MAGESECRVPAKRVPAAIEAMKRQGVGNHDGML